jgi:DNA-binding transcriptional MerR regulator
MAKYSISDLERLSGIRAHTIRIWERRYNLFSPDRSDTNIRNYSDSDLRKILNISILSNHGYKISKIAGMPEMEINETVSGISGNDQNSLIQELIGFMVILDEDQFTERLDEAIQAIGMEKTMLEIVYPFMEKIGILWMTGSISPAQEHFISNLIRQKLIAGIDKLKTKRNPDRPTFLLYLPEHELHEIGILLFHYVLSARKFNVIYLGQSVPYEDLASVSEVRPAQYVLTSVISPLYGVEINKYFETLCKDFPRKHIFASGMYAVEHLQYKALNLTLITRGDQFLASLEALDQR